MTRYTPLRLEEYSMGVWWDRLGEYSMFRPGEYLAEFLPMS